jgi:hypothetical protein
LAALAADLESFMARVEIKEPAPLSDDVAFPVVVTPELRRARAEYDRSYAEWKRDALLEYHDKYRALAISVLGGEDSPAAKVVRKPKSVADLALISLTVRSRRGDARAARIIAKADAK